MGKWKRGGCFFIGNGVPQFAPLYEPHLLPGATASFQAQESANRILSELAPMACCMLVSLEERAFRPRVAKKGFGPPMRYLEVPRVLANQVIVC